MQAQIEVSRPSPSPTSATKENSSSTTSPSPITARRGRSRRVGGGGRTDGSRVGPSLFFPSHLSPIIHHFAFSPELAVPFLSSTLPSPQPQPFFPELPHSCLFQTHHSSQCRRHGINNHCPQGQTGVGGAKNTSHPTMI